MGIKNFFTKSFDSLFGGTTENLTILAGSEQELTYGDRGWETLFSEGGADTSTPKYPGLKNSAFAGLMDWSNSNITQASLQMVKRVRGGEERVVNHPVIDLLYNPNPYYDLNELLERTNEDLNSPDALGGNSFWLLRKSFNGRGIPYEIYHLPRKSMRLVNSETSPTGIEAYERSVNGKKFRYELDEIIHFKAPLSDPADPRLGYSAVRSAIEEFATDIAASKFPGTLLSNNAVLGLVLIPEDDSIKPHEAELMCEALDKRFTGSSRGRTAVLLAKMRLEKMSFSPKDLDLNILRMMPEHRMANCLHIPLEVTELAAGKEKTAFNNVESAERRAYTNHLEPIWNRIARKLNNRLLPEFGISDGSFYLKFSTEKILALQEDKKVVEERAVAVYTGGIATINEARARVGLPPIEGGDVLHSAPVSPENRNNLPDKKPAKMLGAGHVDGEIIEEEFIS